MHFIKSEVSPCSLTFYGSNVFSVSLSIDWESTFPHQSKNGCVIQVIVGLDSLSVLSSLDFDAGTAKEEATFPDKFMLAYF